MPQLAAGDNTVVNSLSAAWPAASAGGIFSQGKLPVQRLLSMHVRKRLAVFASPAQAEIGAAGLTQLRE